MKKIALLSIISVFSTTIFCQTESPRPLISKKIANINMQSFMEEDSEWDENDYEKFLVRYLDMRLNPSPRMKRSMAFSLLQAVEKQSAPLSNTIIDVATWKDLDLFYGKSDNQKYLANTIDKTSTELGKVCLYNMLAQPLAKSVELQNRQAIVKALVDNATLVSSLEHSLNGLNQSENIMNSLWRRDSFKNGAQNSYFSSELLAALNNNDTALLLKSSYAHGKRVFYTCSEALAAVGMLTYGALYLSNNTIPDRLETYAARNQGPILSHAWDWKNRWVHTLVAFVGATWLGMSAKENYNWLKACFKLEECIETLMIHIAQYTSHMHTLYQIIRENKALCYFEDFKPLRDFFEKDAQEIKPLADLLKLFETASFQGEPYILSHKGSILRAYAQMHELKDHFAGAMVAAGKVDAYLSVAKLFTQTEKYATGFCFPEYAQTEKPFIAIHSFWHPIIGSNQTVTNSLALGTDNNRNNMIITGPNAGGKSTILKSVATCLILAQTMGIAPARSMTFTPFSSIATYLNITDDIGAGNSLFKSEVLRTQKLIDQIAQAKQGEFSFAVFDEIFNGTSPVEGTAAAYSVAKHLGNFEKNICMIATHFPLLTKLEQDSPSFSNYKVSVVKYSDGSISYPFKLEKGISQQHVAIDILRNQGFAHKILDDAQAIIKQSAGQ